jgi:uncharacterized RDD family membrane protein YckC
MSPTVVVPDPDDLTGAVKESVPSEKRVPQVRPWVRYFARLIDYYLFGIALGIAFSLVAPSVLENMHQLLIAMVAVFLWIFTEASLLSSGGTTPGKWLLRTKLRDSKGRKLTYRNALKRSFSVWWKGLGIGIPIVSLVTLIVAYNKLTGEGLTTWDREGDFVVSHNEIGVLRSIVAIVLYIGFTLLSV